MNGDRILVILLIIAIIVAVVGVYLNISKMNQITGLQSGGNISVNITQQLTISLPDATCNLGEGYVTAPYAYGIVSVNGSNNYIAQNWTVSVAPELPGFLVRNDGNIELYVCVTSNKSKEDFFGGGTSWRQFYGFWSTEKEERSCTTGGIPFDWPKPVGNLTSQERGICYGAGSLRPQDESDEVYVNCYLKVSDDTPPGYKSDVWTFTAKTTPCAGDEYCC
ncbi:MAG: hypothetical protein QXM27_01345 [Candidatus Pacearchaeota archaeon]